MNRNDITVLDFCMLNHLNDCVAFVHGLPLATAEAEKVVKKDSVDVLLKSNVIELIDHSYFLTNKGKELLSVVSTVSGRYFVTK